MTFALKYLHEFKYNKNSFKPVQGGLNSAISLIHGRNTAKMKRLGQNLTRANLKEGEVLPLQFLFYFLFYFNFYFLYSLKNLLNLIPRQ